MSPLNADQAPSGSPISSHVALAIEPASIGSDHRHDPSAQTVSVVIPTRNSASVIRQCLASVLEQTLVPHEVVICDGGSTDATVSIAAEMGARVVFSQPNRSLQRNLGAAEASGHYLLFIDSDMQLSPGVVRQCIEMFQVNCSALVIPEIFRGEGFWAKVRGFERSFYDDVWWMQAARCFRREQFLEVGGFDVGLVGPEDWDLDERMRKLGTVRSIEAPIYHNEGRLALSTVLRKKSHYSKSFEAFRERQPSRAALCLSPTARIRSLLSHPTRLAAHPILTGGLSVLGIAEVAIVKRWT